MNLPDNGQSRVTVIRLLAGFILAAVILWVAGWNTIRLRQRAEVELGQLPDPSLPHYDCFEESRGKKNAERNPVLLDVTDRLGIDFEHVVGPLGTYFMPESIGAGVAVFDYDGDGLMDLYFVNCGESPKSGRSLPPDVRFENRLFRQLENGRFADVTRQTGLGDTGYGAGVAVGDIDNDGRPDVFIANYGQDALYRNNGQGGFDNITASLNREEQDWGTAAAFFDYDRDGWLDLFVVNYTEDPQYRHSVACGFQHGMVSYCGPHKFLPTVDRLYRNETGDPGNTSGSIVFRDVTEESGLSEATSFGFGTICLDLTGDGWPDIFVANDGAANRLWVNQQNGTFVEEALPRGVACNSHGAMEAGMGVAVADVNGDLLPDLLLTHLTTETATLYLSTDQGYFVDRTEGSGIDTASRRHTGWGTALIDLDHDGYPDLPIINGLVIPCHSGFPFHGEDQFQQRLDVIDNAREYWKYYADQNVLLMGAAEMRFSAGSHAGGELTSAVESGRSLAYGDLDNDGDPDLIVTNCGNRARIYRNDFERRGNWLTLRLETGQGGRDAYGARVVLHLNNGRKLAGFSVPQSSYLSSNDSRLNFGLGESDQVMQITIDWPDGPVDTATELFPGCEINTIQTIQRGRGKPAERVQDVAPVD